MGGSIVPSKRTSKSLTRTLGDIGREARKGELRDLRRVLSLNVDGQMSTDRVRR